jgi:hypothetical protein
LGENGNDQVNPTLERECGLTEKFVGTFGAGTDHEIRITFSILDHQALSLGIGIGEFRKSYPRPKSHLHEISNSSFDSEWEKIVCEEENPEF